MAEEWRAVVGWEELYEVSSLGRVRSLPRTVPVVGHRLANYTSKHLRGRVLSGWVANNGYLTVGLGGKAATRYYLVHRLVCEAFHGPAPKGYEVCHGPNGKLDNRASQIRWGTRSENHGIDRDRDGTKIFGEKHHNSILTEKDVLEIWKSDRTSSPTVAKKYGVAPRTIRDIWNKKTWVNITNMF